MESGQSGGKISTDRSARPSNETDSTRQSKAESSWDAVVKGLDSGIDIPLPGDSSRPLPAEKAQENTERALRDRPAINREPSPHKVETIPEQNGSVPIVLKNADVAPPNSSKRENPAAAEPTAAPGRDRSQTPGEESKSVADTIPGAVAQASPQVRSDVRSNAAQLDRGLEEGPKAATTSVDRGGEGAPPGSSRSNANEPKAAFDSGGSTAKTGLSPDVPSVTPPRDASKESPVSQAQQGPSRPGESVETRLGTGKGLDSTEYGVTNAQAKPVQDLMRQSTPPQVEGSRLTANCEERIAESSQFCDLSHGTRRRSLAHRQRSRAFLDERIERAINNWHLSDFNCRIQQCGKDLQCNKTEFWFGEQLK